MAIMAMDTVKNKKLSAVYIALLFSQYTYAGEWQFTPSMTLEETYSDNVELTRHNEISSLVSQSIMSINSSYVAKHARFNLSADSTYALYSHDHDLDKGYINLSSDVSIQLWPNGISFIGSANIENKARNSSRNSLADIVSADTSQVETYNAGLGYNIANSLFSFGSNVSYQITQSDDNFGEMEGYIIGLNSKNGSSSKSLFWDINGSYQESKNNNQTGRMHQNEMKLGFITDYKVTPFFRYYDEDNTGNIVSNQSFETNSYGLGLSWLITPRMFFDISYNKPIGSSVDREGKEQEEYVDASINWQPSVRTQLEASYSQRFYGDSYGLSFNHSNKRLTNNISYSESVKAFTRNNFNVIAVGSFWCPKSENSISDSCFLQDVQNVNTDDYSLFTLTDFELVEDNQFSLNKILSWTSTLALARTTFSLNINTDERESLANKIKDNTQSASFTMKRKVSGKSSINLKLSFTDKHLQKNSENSRRDRYRQYGISYERAMNQSLKTSFDLAYVNRASGLELYNYQEGRVSFKITKDF